MQTQELTPVEDAREAIEALEPAITQYERKFTWRAPGGAEVEVNFRQAEMGMFPAQEFLTIISEVIDKVARGEMGIKLGELFRGDLEMPDAIDPETVDRMIDENMQLLQAIVKLIQALPVLQLDVIVISLGVPRHQREWAKEQLAQPPHMGGLSVDDGFELLGVFIEQNGDLIREKLMGKARELVEKFNLHVLKRDTSTETSQESTSAPDDGLGGMPSSTSSVPTLESDSTTFSTGP